MGFHHVGQAGLELPTSGDPPALASKVLGLKAWATMPGQLIKVFEIIQPPHLDVSDHLAHC